MASIELITKAKISQAGMKSVFGVSPELDIREKTVRVFYPPDKLRIAQSNFQKRMEEPPGDLRVEINPVITPYILKKMAIPAFVLFVSGFMLSKFNLV